MKYTHDCEHCIPLGEYENHDLYYCDQGLRPTVIARYGNEGWDYRSGMEAVAIDPVLKKAYDRAKAKGLIK